MLGTYYSKFCSRVFPQYCAVGISLLILLSCSSTGNQPEPVELSLSTYRSLQDLQDRCPVIDDWQIHIALERVVTRLESGHTLSRIYVLDCRVPFSLVAPERVVFLSRGMLELMPSEASLAFLLAHELGHHQLGHLDTYHSRDKSYLPEDERKADRFALKSVIGAHYNPWAALQVFSSPAFMEHTSHYDSTTHPIPAERRRALEDLLAQSKWTPPGTVSSRSFLRMKKSLSS